VFGVADEISDRSESLAKEHGVQHAFGSVDEAVQFAPADVVFDVAIPGHEKVFLEHIPHLRRHFVQPARLSSGYYVTPQEPGCGSDLMD
jgi:L-fuconate dehydratase